MKDPTYRSLSTVHRGTETLHSYEIEAGRSLGIMLRESIKVPETHTYYYEHGYKSGELHESNLWQIAANIENARPFSALETIDVPDFHVGLLLDCSGSMSQRIRSKNLGGLGMGRDVMVMNAARILGLGFGHALGDRSGIHLSICGHTETGGSVILYMVKKPDEAFDPEQFKHLYAQSGNLDGIALVAYAREMAKAMREGEPGMLVLISDGAPCHTEQIMRKAFDICKRQFNITVLPIGVGDDLDDATCKRFYGAGNYVLARNVISAAPTIATRANQLMSELKPM